MDTREDVIRRLDLLKSMMKDLQVDFYLVSSSDYHASEYVDDFFKVSEYFSGCTSDNVKLLVEADSVRLWTDGRYFISAQKELEGTEIILMKSGQENVPTLYEYLRQTLKEEMSLAFDGRTISAGEGRILRTIARENHAKVDGRMDLADRIWDDRPAFPAHEIRVLPDTLTGEAVSSKLYKVREEVRERGASYLILSRLDDIMWLFNIRGNDILYNPVALSYAIVGMDTVDLFPSCSRVDGEFRDYCRRNRIKLHDYNDFFDYVRDYHFDGAVMLDDSATSDALHNLMKTRAEVVKGMNPTTRLKAIKNPTELSHIREIYRKDSVAVCRFVYWAKQEVKTGRLTEKSAANKIDEMRAALPEYLDLSFQTISAYNENAAMAHYSPEPDGDIPVKDRGFLLVDSGGQYLGGTTDVTRTMVMGQTTKEMKRDFTLVAMANLRLLFAKFPYGCTGVNLDTYARAPLWKAGIDFGHGTGHGIGYILNVHEGPQAIRWRAGVGGKDPIMEPGMITSDEPGIYREDQWGIRTETIMLCVEDEVTEFGRFLSFEPLTYVPIDLEALDPAYMDESDVIQLNEYHRLVYENISPYLQGKEKDWLKEATAPLTKAR